MTSTGPVPGGTGGTGGRHQPRVIAHRGASSAQPEHTLAAYTRALEDGADGVECDVRLSADGHLVCVHDRRVERTSNGRGVVSTLSLRQMQALDWSSWKRPWRDLDDEALDPEPADTGVLTLQRLLGVVRDWGRPVEIAIETKHPTRYGGLVERRLVQALERFGWAHPQDPASSPARLMSFSWLSLRRCHRLAPALETVYLMEQVPARLRNGRLPRGVQVTGPSMEIVRNDPGYVDRAHASGKQVYVWVANSRNDIGLCRDRQVDGVITDRPALARELLAAE